MIQENDNYIVLEVGDAQTRRARLALFVPAVQSVWFRPSNPTEEGTPSASVVSENSTTYCVGDSALRLVEWLRQRDDYVEQKRTDFRDQDANPITLVNLRHAYSIQFSHGRAGDEKLQKSEPCLAVSMPQHALSVTLYGEQATQTWDRIQKLQHVLKADLREVE